jgi:LacI family transcriptional regulator
MFLRHPEGMVCEAPPRRVAILVETGRSYPRAILRGIRRYLAAHRPWATYVGSHSKAAGVPAWLKDWDGDGLIVQCFSGEMAEVLAQAGIPGVELRSSRYHSVRPFVGCDNREVGALVARHFLERGYGNFASLSIATEDFFRERTANFATVLRASGHHCEELPQLRSERPADYEAFLSGLVSALSGLPRPLAVLAANDQAGVYLLDACRRAGYAVPDEIAVVGAENDETLCEFAVPEMSSVQFNGEGVGYKAALLLDHLMDGGTAPDQPLLLPPLGIVTRGSSDDLAIRDQLVIRAVRLLREHLAEGITVGDLVKRLHCSRSTLERRMKLALGRNPGDELQSLRMSRIEHLLTGTDLTIETIAKQTGIAQPTHLHALFRSKHGMTPGAYRRSHGVRD